MAQMYKMQQIDLVGLCAVLRLARKMLFSFVLCADLPQMNGMKENYIPGTLD